jgi:hypothetical protein
MLHDLDKTLENLLRNEGKIGKSEVDIAFDQPTGDWSAKLSRPTLNCFCFDLRENVKLRRTERMVAVDMEGKSARTVLPSRRFDLTYLVTAWARKIEDEHQLLWRALQTLKRIPILKPENCEGLLRYQRLDLPIVVADMTDSKLNLVDLWSVLDNQLRLGFTTCITLDMDIDVGFDSPLVLEGTFRVGEALDPTQRELTTKDVEIKHPRPRGRSVQEVKPDDQSDE